MFGPKLGTIFKSRWSAMWWALGVLFTAWQLVPAADADNPPTAAPAAAKPPPTNPWSK